MSEFYEYFKENMAGLGLPAPESLFGSVQSTVTTANSILGLIDKFGPRVTVLELGGAGTRVEILGVLGSCSAAYYLGAVIGSLAVAAGRSAGRGSSLSDTIATAVRYGFDRPWLAPLLQMLPGIYNPAVATRANYRHYARVA